MGNTQIETYRVVLKTKEAELAKGLENRAEITIEKASDELDEVQLAGDRELAISNLNRESHLLHAVRAALSRIADGSYGTCLNCGEEIKRQRLNAVPWTAYCIRCQQAVDERELGTGAGWAA